MRKIRSTAARRQARLPWAWIVWVEGVMGGFEVFCDLLSNVLVALHIVFNSDLIMTTLGHSEK